MSEQEIAQERMLFRSALMDRLTSEGLSQNKAGEIAGWAVEKARNSMIRDQVKQQRKEQ